MRRIKIQLAIIFLMSLIFASCQNNDDFETQVITALLALDTDKISTFDVNTDMDILIETIEGISVNSIDVLKGDNKIADAIISGNNATFNSSTLLPLEAGSVTVDLQYEISNGFKTNKLDQIEVVLPVSFTDEITELKFRDNTMLNFDTFTDNATIDGVLVSWKIGEDGTYTDITEDFSTEGDAIPLNADTYINDYAVMKGDILFIRVRVNSGSLVEDIEKSVKIIPQNFGSDKTFTIMNNMEGNQANLLNSETFVDADDLADIIFANDGFEAIPETSISFVQISSNASQTFYNEYNDVEIAKSDFDALTPQTSVSNINPGDVFVYKATRQVKKGNDDVETQDFYGTILITNVNFALGAVTSIDFISKENTIIE